MLKLMSVSFMLWILAGCESTTSPNQVVIADFGFPWSEKPAPKTEFRAHTDQDRLYFEFHVTDTDIVLSERWRLTVRAIK